MMHPERDRFLVRVTLIILVELTMEISGKKGVFIPHSLMKPPLLDQYSYKTTYACEGKTLHILCENGVIHLIRANYGRFSISICNDHGNLDWRVNCMSYHSFLIMQERCSLKPNCSVNVSSSTFHDPCPGTRKYLEVQYHCGKEMPLLTTPITSPPPLLKPMSGVDTTVPQGNKTYAVIPMSATDSPEASKLSTVSTATKPPMVTKTQQFPVIAGFSERNIITSTNRTLEAIEDEFSTLPPTKMPPAKTSTTTTKGYSSDYYCPSVYSRGINWTWTKAGETAILKCPDGASGFAKWHCNRVPILWTPDDPDLRQCRSLWLENIKRRMEDGDSIISVTAELALMSLAKPLFSEDLKEIGDLIKKALYKGANSMENVLDMWHRYHVLRELLQSLVQTLSNLLDDKQKTAWNDLTVLERKTVISSLLEGLEESALLLAETSSHDGSFSLVKNNVLLSLKVLPTKDSGIQFPTLIQFPAFEEINSEVDGIYWTAMQDKLLLPSQALHQYSRHGFIKVVFTAFNNVDEYLEPSSNILHYPHDHLSENVTRIVNSRIIAASLERAGNPTLFQPVVITLKHLKEDNATNPICVFWDFHSREWSARGCWVELSNRSHTTCACDHLTNFAVVMELNLDMISTPDLEILHTVISVGCIVAVACLLFTVVVLISLRITSDSSIIHKNMFLCFLVSEVVFVGGIVQTKYVITCAIVAGVLQYFFLASFLWLFFECYQEYLKLISSCDDTQKSQARWYYAVAYSLPAVIVIVSAIIDPSSYGTKKYCWLQADNYFVFSFVGPAVGIIFGGMVFLCISVFVFCHHTSIATVTKGNEEAKLANIKSWSRRSLVLTILVSLTWTSGLLYVNKESVLLAYTFSALNCMQGTSIVCLYCLRNEKVKQELKKILNTPQFMPFCLRHRKKEQSPQNISLPPPIKTTSGEQHIPQQFWNLAKDLQGSTSQNCTIQGRPSMMPARKMEHEASHQNKRIISKFGEAVVQTPQLCDLGKILMHEKNCTTQLPTNYQLSDHCQQSQYRHFLTASDANNQFVDHIYESIDDDDQITIDSHEKAYIPHQQFPPAENYYGDHSDLSQHSSSSYGYDQQPLLITGAGTQEEDLQQAYSVSKDYSGARNTGQKYHDVEDNYETEESVLNTRNKNTFDKTCSTSHSPYNSEMGDSIPGTKDYSLTGQSYAAAPEDSGPSLPDLLQCPADSAVVLAVLEGDKVVSQLQQDDAQTHQPQYKLSTYC